MKNQILANIDNASELEKLYRSSKAEFKKQIQIISQENNPSIVIQVWQERLQYNESKMSIGRINEIKNLIIFVFIFGLIANISNLPHVEQEFFFPRNTAFIIVGAMSCYFLWKKNSQPSQWIKILSIIGLAAFYINLLPNNPKSSTINLVLVHMPIVLWMLLGFVFIEGKFNAHQLKIEFLKFNGDLLILSGIIGLSCMLFTAITFGLFKLIGVKIEEFYFHYILIWAIPGIPLLASFLILNNPQIINRISPIIAKIFTPLAFINLLIYIISIFYLGKFPQHDREMLFIFNILLIVVLALIFFSIVESKKTSNKSYSVLILSGLSLLTIIINGIVLVAIILRIYEFGISPNRIAVLGGNLLIFINLLIVCIQLLQVVLGKKDLDQVELSIVKYLPIYGIWAAFVCFVIPWLFSLQ